MIMNPIYIADYNYPLPDDRIAKYPIAERDHSKLLVYRPYVQRDDVPCTKGQGVVTEDHFYNVGEYIIPGSLLIYNNTRVIQARLEFHKKLVESQKSQVESEAVSQGARIEVFCLEPLEPHDYQLSLGSTTGCVWKCMVGNAKKWKEGNLSLILTTKEGTELELRAYKEAQTGNTYAVRFEWDNEKVSFAEILDAAGELPIPPYLNRKTEESDKRTYQTVYSRIKGSVAAPTAGLHFTERVLEDLRNRGIETDEVTLHVGAGTFLPVKTADANEHTMHTEIIAVNRATIEHIISKLGKIVAVGTTSMRTLESLYFMGCKKSAEVAQFDPYEQEYTLSTREALQSLLDWMDATGQETLHGETQIMIKPGYEFHVVDQLITNFHQPQSTLLLLVSAFVGGDWKTIYDYALAHDFRFLSYGDSSILNRV
ncbi:MAG: tRNA preQ1(34) S-adenosylmethionine ribosyltransferase-isomerase QueA [Paludibacteraceae bacterium]|nr:tRNA preQ1(34) S-adenosylmethionine ribosyltransferase-isomerase QueA [Paludibacteraceae bacterium]